jgi:hypothetical protein
MFCTKCGKELAEGSKFCPMCGTQVTTVKATSADVPGDSTQPFAHVMTKSNSARYYAPVYWGFILVVSCILATMSSQNTKMVDMRIQLILWLAPLFSLGMSMLRSKTIWIKAVSYFSVPMFIILFSTGTSGGFESITKHLVVVALLTLTIVILVSLLNKSEKIDAPGKEIILPITYMGCFLFTLICFKMLSLADNYSKEFFDIPGKSELAQLVLCITFSAAVFVTGYAGRIVNTLRSGSIDITTKIKTLLCIVDVFLIFTVFQGIINGRVDSILLPLTALIGSIIVFTKRWIGIIVYLTSISLNGLLNITILASNELRLVSDGLLKLTLFLNLAFSILVPIISWSVMSKGLDYEKSKAKAKTVLPMVSMFCNIIFCLACILVFLETVISYGFYPAIMALLIIGVISALLGCVTINMLLFSNKASKKWVCVISTIAAFVTLLFFTAALIMY